jgi:transcriptional regulator with XRE-family HTH domain
VLAVAEDAVGKVAARRDRLAQRRKALGLTQEGLAGLLNVERSTVFRWEHGECEPLPWIRPKLARALKVPAGRLEALLAADDRAGSGASAAQVPRQLPAAGGGLHRPSRRAGGADPDLG